MSPLPSLFPLPHGKERAKGGCDLFPQNNKKLRLIGKMPLQIVRNKIVGKMYRIYEIVTRQRLNSQSGGTERIGLLIIPLPWREGLGEGAKKKHVSTPTSVLPHQRGGDNWLNQLRYSGRKPGELQRL